MSEVQSTFTQDDRRELIELTVTMKNVREDLQEMRAVASERDKNQTGVTSALEKRMDSYRQETDKRIRILEDFRWYILGAVAAAGVLGGLFSRFLNH